MSVHDEWEESDFLQRVAVALILAIAAWWVAGCSRDVRPIQNATPMLVHTLPPASFWICPSEVICRASNDPSDIPPGYVCISQANKVTVCSPGGQIKTPARPKEKR